MRCRHASRPHTSASLLGVAAAVAVLLSGCNGEESTGASDEETSAQPEASDSPGPTDASEATGSADHESESDGEITPPGTELAVGDTATLPVTFAGDDATLDLTVTGIEEGENSDLDSLDFSEDISDLVPYYITVDMTVVEADEGFGSYEPGGDMGGLIGDVDASWVGIAGDFEPCQSESFELNVQPGDSVTTCLVAGSIESAGPVDGADFTGSLDEYGDAPVIWRQ